MTTVAKVIELSASSPTSIEDAVQGGLHKAARSIKHIKGAWINDIKVVTSDDGTVTEWRVDMKVSFLVS